MKQYLSRRGMGVLSAAGMVLALSLTAAPASAMTGASVPLAPAGGSCGIFVDTGEIVCAEAGEDLHDKAFEETGRVVIDEASGAAARGVSATYILGKLYDFADYNSDGGVYEFWSSNACTPGTWQGGNLPSAWLGRISSAKGFSNCLVTVYEMSGYGGASYGAYAQMNMTSALNNKVSSVKFSR